ncbi:DUF551 domain-containing protein [Variovorax paradoxus]|nr:DUF551 domain-containing protein [Variovorax paradoxus]MBT2300351.1 DUF551 domain-containing protein [Variovorax paradoxus]
MNLPELPESQATEWHPFKYTADQLRAYAEEAVKQEREAHWQPIETAPKDDSEFLAYRRGEIAAAKCFIRDDGEMWSFGRQSAHRDVFPEIVPTHWMRLPEPPEPVK